MGKTSADLKAEAASPDLTGLKRSSSADVTGVPIGIFPLSYGYYDRIFGPTAAKFPDAEALIRSFCVAAKRGSRQIREDGAIFETLGGRERLFVWFLVQACIFMLQRQVL